MGTSRRAGVGSGLHAASSWPSERLGIVSRVDRLRPGGFQRRGKVALRRRRPRKRQEIVAGVLTACVSLVQQDRTKAFDISVAREDGASGRAMHEFGNRRGGLATIGASDSLHRPRTTPRRVSAAAPQGERGTPQQRGLATSAIQRRRWPSATSTFTSAA